MQLITLNIWGGQVKESLLEFISAHQEVDFLCLQEVNHRAPCKTTTDDNPVCLDILDQIAERLPHHRFFFRPVVNNVYGLAMLVKKNIELFNEGEVTIHENPDYPGRAPTHQRNLQWMQCRLQEKEFMIVNTHFLWNGVGKNDSPERIQQSHKVKSFLDSVNMPKIICGDFNLRPDTKSIEILEENMRNLVKEYKIQSTRTSLYPKPERFADYILVSNEVIVHDFKVLPEEVSDHAALKLEFFLKD